MQLRCVDLKLPDHAEHQLHQQRAAISVEQLVQRPADAIVVEELALARAETQQRRVEPPGPVGKTVERLARHAQVAHQQADRGGGRQHDAPVAGRQVARQHALHTGPRQEQIDDRQRAESLGLKLEWRLRVIGHGWVPSATYDMNTVGSGRNFASPTR
jgi:hypothetical protein